MSITAVFDARAQRASEDSAKMTGSIMALTARDCLPPPPAALRAAARRRYAALRATLGAALRAAQNVPNTENAPDFREKQHR